MRLHSALKDKVMDQRLMDKMIGEGKLNKVQIDSYLAALPDDSANVEQIPLDYDTQSTNVRAQHERSIALEE